MQQYWLTPHVYGCRTDDHAVLLDLKHNVYLGLSAQDVATLERLLSTNVETGQRYPSALPDIDGTTLASELTAKAVLTTEPPSRPHGWTTLAEPPELPLIDGYEEVCSRIRLVDVMAFVRAVVFVWFGLKWRSLEYLIRRTEERSTRSIRSSRDVDVYSLQEAADKYARLRRLLFTARDECLFDSIAMCNFLLHRGIVTRCVFGVSTTPFAAHCWVQWRKLVVNDMPEHVRAFTPILII